MYILTMDTYNKLCNLRPYHLIQTRQVIQLDEELQGIYSTYNDKIIKYNKNLHCFKDKKSKPITTGGNQNTIIVI